MLLKLCGLEWRKGAKRLLSVLDFAGGYHSHKNVRTIAIKPVVTVYLNIGL